MNKLLNIFISIVFLISFIGVQVNKHYSNGKLYSVALYVEADHCYDEMGLCKMDHMAMGHHQAKHSCSCKDESEMFRLNNVFVSEKFSLPTATSHELCSNLVFNLVETNLFTTVFSSSIKFSWSPHVDNNLQAELGVFLC